MPCYSSTCFDRSGNLGLLVFCTLVHAIKEDVSKKKKKKTEEGRKKRGRKGGREGGWWEVEEEGGEKREVKGMGCGGGQRKARE